MYQLMQILSMCTYLLSSALNTDKIWQQARINTKTGDPVVLLPFDGPKENMMSTQGFMIGCVDTTAANNRHHTLNSISVKREQNTSQLH